MSALKRAATPIWALDLADHPYLETGRVALGDATGVMRRDESMRRVYLGY
jgi:hypothetical protein